MIIIDKGPGYINKSAENLKFPMIRLDHYLGQALRKEYSPCKASFLFEVDPLKEWRQKIKKKDCCFSKIE